jgi:hypothetical protein
MVRCKVGSTVAVSASHGMQERTRAPEASVWPAICGSTSLSNAMWYRDRRPAWVLSRAAPRQMRSGASSANPARSLEDTTATGKLGSEYLALCLTVKDNHRYIREWVAHHRAVGAGELHTLPLKTLMHANVTHTFGLKVLMGLPGNASRQGIFVRHRQPRAPQ